MKFKVLMLAILSLLFNFSILAENPNVRIVFSEKVEYCENCREHSFDGWRIKFRLENLSNRPIFVSGLWVNTSEGKKNNDSRYFFPNNFSQFLDISNCKWRYNSKNENPGWLVKNYLLNKDKLSVKSQGHYNLRPTISWNFNEYQIVRREVVVINEDGKNFYEVKSPTYSLIRNGKDNDVILMLTPNPC